MSALRLVRPLCRNLRCQPSDQLLRRSLNCPRLLCAFISSKANMGDYERPAPFPYKEKYYSLFYQTFDRTSDRFYENTKVLVVDGPIAAGKTTFAKELAKELDMLYFPEVDLNDHFYAENGVNMLELNHLVRPRAQLLTVKEWSVNPKHPNAGPMQVNMLLARFNQYMESMAHLLNTGQGIVLDRSLYSDFVFMDAMFEAGYMSKKVRKYYLDVLVGVKSLCKQPHLFIYLDIPVSVVKERVKERNRSWEVNSPVLTDQYLNCIERNYKLRFLKEISMKSEVLIYDWSNFGDVEVVVEDIERMDFEVQEYSRKYSDWKVHHDREYNRWRMMYTNDREDILNQVQQADLIDEVMMSHWDAEKWEELIQKAGGVYADGYDPKKNNVLFK